ncbi:hypothetical protein [Caudoviricetes sp.]|nr:hypothetical protein [Caudoviricetes sp.]
MLTSQRGRRDRPRDSRRASDPLEPAAQAGRVPRESRV